MSPVCFVNYVPGLDPTQGLRPGLQSVAASRLHSVAAWRLDSGGFGPPGQSEIEFSHSSKALIPLAELTARLKTRFSNRF